MRWCTAPVHCLVIVRCKPRKKVCWMTRILSETVWNDESARMLSGFTNRKGVCALTCGFSIRLCFPAPSHYLASMIILYDDDCSTSPSHDKDNFIQSLDKNCPKPEVRVMLDLDTFLLIIVIKNVIVRISINNTQPLNSKRHDPQPFVFAFLLSIVSTPISSLASCSSFSMTLFQVSSSTPLFNFCLHSSVSKSLQRFFCHVPIVLQGYQEASYLRHCYASLGLQHCELPSTLSNTFSDKKQKADRISPKDEQEMLQFGNPNVKKRF